MGRRFSWQHLGTVSVGHRVRLGKVGIDDNDDVVEGVVLLQRGYKALPVLDRVREKVDELNKWKLPAGVKVKTFYDRTALIHTTVETVTDILISGMVLVFVILFVFLGHLRARYDRGVDDSAVALVYLYDDGAGRAVGQSDFIWASIDFGIIVDATLIMVESIFIHLAHDRRIALTVPQQIVRAARQVGRPIFFSTAIIVVAFVPLFTMTGVPGKIFAPMSITYGFALLGALLMAFTLAPVLCSLLLSGPIREEDTAVVRVIAALPSGGAALGVGPTRRSSWDLHGRSHARRRSAIAIRRRGIHAGLGGGKSVGASHDAGRYLVRSSGSTYRRNSSDVSGFAGSQDDRVSTWAAGRRHRSDQFFQCGIPGQLEAGRRMALGTDQGSTDRRDRRAAEAHSRRDLQFFAGHSGQCRRGHVRGERRELNQVVRDRFENDGGEGGRNRERHERAFGA